MLRNSRITRLACLLLTLAWGGVAQAQQQFLLTGPDDGAQWQIGTGLPLPVGTAGIFFGGIPDAAGQSQGDAGIFPPLNVPPSPGKIVTQDLATTMGGAINMPRGLFSQPAAGTPNKITVVPSNYLVFYKLFQVATTLSYVFPSTTQAFAPGSAPGPGVFTTAGGGIITYDGGAKAFGGSAQFELKVGPGAAGGALGPAPITSAGGGGTLPIASVWINIQGKVPASVTRVALMGAALAGGANTALAQVGAPIASPPVTTMFGPVTAARGGVRAVNVTGTTPCCTVGPIGTINSSIPLAASFASNMVTASKGFPWTTGKITVSQPGAGPAEIFFASGTDMRVAGVGNVSLVSGALSLRAVSGPNANRGWVSMTLPEPTAAVGAAGALGLLGLCHTVVRRRRADRDRA